MLQPVGLPSRKLHRIIRQDLRYAILGQWLTEEVAIEMSDGILGPPSKTPNDDLKDAILRRSEPEKAGRVWQETSAVVTCTPAGIYL